MQQTPGATPPPSDLRDSLAAYVGESADKFAAIAGVRDLLHELSPNNAMPVDLVRWIPLEMVEPNDYNPNKVAKQEMGLLLRSIQSDGYTQPVVAIWDEVKQKYIIVDGFHRYAVMTASVEVNAGCHGRLPVVVLEKSISERMASTVRHNRARGKHSINGMSSMVFQMLDQGMTDAEICNELGLEAEELLRLKHLTGFSKLFENHEYNKAWVSRNQIRLKVARAEQEEAQTRLENERVQRRAKVRAEQASLQPVEDRHNPSENSEFVVEPLRGESEVRA